MSETRDNSRYNSYWLTALVAGLTALLLFMVISLGQDIDEHSLKQTIFHLEDEKEELSIENIDELNKDTWKENTGQNFGLTSATQWLKVDIQRASYNQLLEIDYAMLDSIQVWFRAKVDGQYAVIKSYQLGDKQIFEKRPIIHDKFLIPLPNADGGIQLLLKINSSGPLKAPLKLWPKHDYIVYTASQSLFVGLFFGYMLAMGLVNVFLYMTTGTTTFITYAGYVFSFALLIAAIHGLGFRFIWPTNIWLQGRIPAISAFLMVSFALIFSSQILELKSVSRKYYILFKVLLILFVISTAASFFAPYELMIKLLFFLLLLSIPAILIVSFRLAFKGSEIAKYFSAAWLVLLLSGLTVTADYFQWINLPLNSIYLLMVGATSETLLLALALASKYSAQRRSVRKAHQQAADDEILAMQMQDELMRVQKQAQLKLEEQVAARTQEFEKAVSDLSIIHKELQGLSETDTLTGLNNRRSFEKALIAETARSRRERKPLAIAVLDIDHFKQVNDTYGHQCGDECLIVFANTLRSVIMRPGDILSRYGGEEFVVILPNTTLAGANAVLEQFKQTVEELVVETHGQHIQFTISIGVTVRVIENEGDGNKMLAYADKLLFQAKEAGRNCIKSSSFE